MKIPKNNKFFGSFWESNDSNEFSLKLIVWVKEDSLKAQSRGEQQY